MKKYLVRIQFKDDRHDQVLLVKTNDIQKFMKELCKDIVDDVYGYEYESLKTMKAKRNDYNVLAGNWTGGLCIKEELDKENKDE